MTRITVTIVLTLLLLALVPRVASAQPLRISQAATVALELADAETTRRGAQRAGFIETNPLIRPIAGRPVILFAVKGVVAAEVVYSVHRMAKGHPRWAFWTSVGFNVFQGAVVAQNVQRLRRGR